MLAGYSEARDLWAQYRRLVDRIRAQMPEFLRPGDALTEAVRRLEPTERLAYLCTTPRGAALLLLSGDESGAPDAESLWDEHLTTAEVLQQVLNLQMALGNLEVAGALFALVETGGLAVDLRDAQGLPSRLTLNLQPGGRDKTFEACLSALGKKGGVLARVAARCHERSVRRLVLVPCGLTGLLPLYAADMSREVTEDAGFDLAARALQDVVQVTYVPSGGVWAACRDRARRHISDDRTALVVGNPLPQPNAVSLPFAELEAQKVASLLREQGYGQVTLLVGEQATDERVRSILASRAHTLTHAHFACHGVADVISPQASALLLARGHTLTVGDLFESGADPFRHLRLAVLSACETGLPGAELPDEVIGLPAGWLQAGAAGVVASLWPVNDNATRALMQTFYELHLRDGLAPPDALWHAQRWLRGVPTWRAEQEAAGAQRGATGPDAEDVLRELAATRTGAEADQEGDRTMAASNRMAQCKPAHWAAFAYYGA
jgi:hypothetical protein